MARAWTHCCKDEVKDLNQKLVGSLSCVLKIEDTSFKFALYKLNVLFFVNCLDSLMERASSAGW
jgi:hypothetical protein